MKKKLTIAQQKNKYKRTQYGCIFMEFISVITPFIAIGAVNYNKYFVEYNGTKMSIAFIMALAVMGIAIWSITKKKLENSFVTLIIGWIVFAFIFQMMGSMITDLATIMWFGLIGILSAYGFDEASKVADKKKKKVIQAIERAKEDDMVSQVKEENK